jgi:AraC-like DNA-binding protein
MSEDGLPSTRPFVPETSSDLGSVTRGGKLFRHRIAGVREPPSLGSHRGLRIGTQVETQVFDLGSGVLIDGSLTPLASRRVRELVARDGTGHCLITLEVAGRATATTGSRTIEFEPGDVTIVDRSQSGTVKHGIEVNGSDGRALTLVLPRGLLTPLRAASDPVPDATVSHNTAFGRLMAEHLLALRRHAPYLSDGESRAAVASIAHLVAGAFGQPADTASRVVTSARATQAAEIKCYIDQNLGSARLEIDDLCRKFHLSRAALYRLFESKDGPAGYIQQRRLDRAFAMLRSPAYRSWRLIDFALDARFSSDATFIRAFRRVFGVTPGEVRAQVEQARATCKTRRRPARSAFRFCDDPP